ncbi:MAG: hypothetical protein Athens071426_410 [Parcubacteria group bacterium Athens0714_26]|nr:MAG: hypothetical protein Athens071426_410 [Parcubacteria group bacterium Athens0714_26]
MLEAIKECEIQLEIINSKWFPDCLENTRWREIQLTIGRIAKKHNLTYQSLEKELVWLPREAMDYVEKDITLEEAFNHLHQKLPLVDYQAFLREKNNL